MKSYAKFIAQVVAAGLAALVIALSDDVVSTSEWINVGIALFGAVAVVLAGETLVGLWRHAKTFAAAGSAGLVYIQSALTDGGVSGSEWVQLALVVLGVFGVAIAPGPRVVTEDTPGAHSLDRV